VTQKSRTLSRRALVPLIGKTHTISPRDDQSAAQTNVRNTRTNATNNAHTRV